MPSRTIRQPRALRARVGPQWCASLLLASTILPLSPASAQTVTTATGAIAGTATDATGAALPGVAVTASSPALMQPRTVPTLDDGSFHIAALPPGSYRVTFALKGFNDSLADGIYVSAGFTAPVHATLVVQGVTERVLVEPLAPVLDGYATPLGTVFDARQLATLPGARSMGSVLAASPSVFVSRFDVGGSAPEPGFYGAFGTSGFNRPMVEGLSIVGILSTGFNLDYGAFEEISVQTGAHGPEWHSPGVSMHFVGKSGGNQHRGTVYAAYSHHDWQSFNVDAIQIQSGASGSAAVPPFEANRLWRYHDLNADAGGYLKADRLWWYLSFRDQETASRQVNFPVTPQRTHLTNYGGKATYRLTPQHTLIAFGQAGRNEQPHVINGLVSGVAARADAEQSSNRALSWGWLGKVEWNAALGDASFLELRGGQFGADRSDSPRSIEPRYEDLITLVVEGGGRNWGNRFRRHQVLGSFSRIADGPLGTHHLKGGGEVFLTKEAELWHQGYANDVLHILRAGDPLEVYLFETPSRSESGLWTYSGYASDAWRIHRRFTVNAGLRLDRYRVFLPEQTHPGGRFLPVPQMFAAVDNVLTRTGIVPRVGAAWDLDGVGRTIVKGSFAKYVLAPGTGVGFNANPNSSQWWRRYTWVDVNRNRRWESGEERLLLARRGGSAIESLDPGLELAELTEAAAWVERELPGRLALRTGVVWRGASGFFARVNANRPFSAFSVPVAIVDPGADGQPGTGDDGLPIAGWDLPADVAALPQVNVVRNIPGAKSRHWTWEITAQRRHHGRWSLLAGFAHVWNGDQGAVYLDQMIRQNPFPATPNDLINTGAYGRHDFTTWTAKVHAIVDGPWGLRLAPLVRHQSGQPFGRTFVTRLQYGAVRVLAEPMGTRRMDHVTLADARLEKTLRLGADRRLAGFVDVFNLLNTNAAQTINWSSGGSFLQPLTIVPPRIARLGVRLDW